MKALIEALKSNGIKQLSGSQSGGRIKYDLFIDDEKDGVKSGTIYRFEELPKGYRLETVKRSDWNDERKGFETLRTVSDDRVYDKKGMKSLKTTLDAIRDAFRYSPNAIVGKFDAITYYGQDVFTKGA